jgi:hypothetical protein
MLAATTACAPISHKPRRALPTSARTNCRAHCIRSRPNPFDANLSEFAVANELRNGLVVGQLHSAAGDVERLGIVLGKGSAGKATVLA